MPPLLQQLRVITMPLSSNGDTTDIEEQLLFRLDEDILKAEEEELLDRLGLHIAAAESSVIQNEDELLAFEQSYMQKALLPLRQRLTSCASNNGVSTSPIIFAVEQRKFLKACQTVPRIKTNRRAKSRVKEMLLQSFSENGATLLTRGDMMGFELTVSSSDPTSWKIEIKGFEQTIQAFLAMLKQEVGLKRL